MTEIEIFARTLYGEARSGDVQDAEAIACVVLNRVGYRNWPISVREVCLQPWQFSCWLQHDDAHARNFNRIISADRNKNKWFDQCWMIAERAMSGAIKDPTRTSTHYHTPAVSPRWSRGKTPVYETQGHVFFNNIDTPAPQTAGEALEQDRPIGETRTVKGGTVAIGATALGAIYEFAGEAFQTAATAIGPLKGFFESDALRWVLVGLAIGGIAHMLYARTDDRKKGLR